MEDLNSLQQSLIGNSVSDIIKQVMAWVVIPTIILTIVITIALVVNMVRRWKVEQAIFEIRDTLHEMKLANLPVAAQPTQPIQSYPPASQQPTPPPQQIS